jgi:hypothetical protein
MPLHDWKDRPGWEGVHHSWNTELLRWIKPRLPAGFRAYIGSVPTIAVGAPADKPDVAVREWPGDYAGNAEASTSDEPDIEIASMTLDPGKSVYVEHQGRLVAAVELISPRNKDRPTARATYLARYAGYLLQGVHLLLVDVHSRPVGFSFADQISQQMQVTQPACSPPLAVSYRVGAPAATGGRMLGIWLRPLQVDQPLPTVKLAITLDKAVPIDLEATYCRAAEDAYL